MTTTEPYPEHAKQARVLEKSATIGAFLDDMSQQGVQLRKWVERDYEEPCAGTLFDGCLNGYRPQGATSNEPTEVRCSTCQGTGTITVHTEGFAPIGRIEEILAGYFQIDLTKIDAEKHAMLSALRQVGATSSSRG